MGSTNLAPKPNDRQWLTGAGGWGGSSCPALPISEFLNQEKFVSSQNKSTPGAGAVAWVQSTGCSAKDLDSVPRAHLVVHSHLELPFQEFSALFWALQVLHAGGAQTFKQAESLSPGRVGRCFLLPFESSATWNPSSLLSLLCQAFLDCKLHQDKASVSPWLLPVTPRPHTHPE